MQHMHVRQVDPRDIGWEIESATYRVYIWRKESWPENSDISYTSDEFEITGTNVLGVLDWIASHLESVDHSYTLYVVSDSGAEPGLIRLAGVDPLSAPL
jgi:hypothetical protein